MNVDMAGDGLYTQEQYLEDLVSYLRAFKPLLSAEVLTLEEMNTYYKLWSMLGADFLWCTLVRSIDPSGVEGTGRICITFHQWNKSFHILPFLSGLSVSTDKKKKTLG